MKKIFLIFVYFIFTSAFFAQEWVAIAKEDNGNITYVNDKNFSNIGNPKIWTKKIGNIKVYSMNRMNEEIKGYQLTFSEYNCENYSFKIIKTLYYKDNDKLFDSMTFSKELDHWNTVIPGTANYIVLDNVCRKFDRNYR